LVKSDFNNLKFCFIGNDADHIPATMIYEFGLKSLVLDVSFNCLRFNLL